MNGGPPNHLSKPRIEGIINPADTFSGGSDHSDTEQDEQILQPTPLEKPLTVDYETRDGMAKHNKDYYSTKGTLVCVLLHICLVFTLYSNLSRNCKHSASAQNYGVHIKVLFTRE